MTIRKLFGTATADMGVFWEDKVNHEGWRIQYNKTLDVASPLKPFRLLDPKGHLWASADELKELAEALPTLCTEFSAKELRRCPRVRKGRAEYRTEDRSRGGQEAPVAGEPPSLSGWSDSSCPHGQRHG
jgi:hypothetical protein